eukprot:610921_1
MMPRGFGILLILLLATLPSVLCAALKDETAKTNGPEAAYSTLQYFDEGFVAPINDFVDTPEYAHEGNGSTSSSPKGNGSTSISPKELSPGSSETSTQSGLEDTTFDIVNIESTLDHNKKSTEDIVNIESTLDDNKKSTEDDYWRKEALKWKKESEEYKQENHKLKAEKAMSKQSSNVIRLPSENINEPYDLNFSSTDLNEVVMVPLIRVPVENHSCKLDNPGENTNFGTCYGGHIRRFKDVFRRYMVHLQCGTAFKAVAGIKFKKQASKFVCEKYEVHWRKDPTLHGKVKSQDFKIISCTRHQKNQIIDLMVWAKNEKHTQYISDCKFAVTRR